MTTPTYATGQGVTAPQFGGSGLASDGTTKLQGLPSYNRTRTVTFVVDLSKFKGTTGQSMALMHFPPFTQVDSFQAYVSTALAAGNGIRFGDGAAYDTYVASDTTVTVNHVYTQAITANPLNFYGSAGGDLNITVTNATLPTTGKITCTLKLTDCSTEAAMTTQDYP